MQITHLGHSCVLVEQGDARVLLDPGNFSDAWHGLTGLSAVVVTHQHPDHLDPDHVPALLEASPDALVLVEPEAHTTSGLGEAFAAGDQRDVGGLRLSAVGGRHAVIHADLGRIGNVGVLVSGDGTTLFHPGDALDTAPEGVDVLAIPAYGPWAAMKETIDFVRAVGAPRGFPIHEQLLAERGWELCMTRFNELTDTEVLDLRDGTPHEF